MSIVIRANLITDIFLLNPCEDNLVKYANTVDDKLLFGYVFDICRKIDFKSSKEDCESYFDYLVDICCKQVEDMCNNDFYKGAFKFVSLYLNDMNVGINDKLDMINDVLLCYDSNVNKDILRDMLYCKLNILLNMDSYDLESIIDTNSKLKELLR